MVAVLSLALGIGANTAIYTLVDQILLRKLPVKSPDELVMLYQQGPHPGSNMGDRMHSYPIYREFQQRAEPLAEVLARRPVETSVTIDGQTERLAAEMVSGNYFTMLGVPPAIGRVFSSEEDDRVYQGHPVVVISHDYWMRRFNGDAGCRGSEDPRQQLPDDDRGRVGGGLCRPRSDALPADPRADPDEAGHRARMGVGEDGRRAHALGAGVRAPQARLHRRDRPRPAAGPVPADPRTRDDAAGREGLLALRARAVHDRARST